MGTQLAQILVEGCINGSSIALVAIGIALIWGVMGLLCFAQGEFLMIGMYLQLSANSDKVIYYYIVLAVVVALIAFTLWLDASRFGYALRTISGNEHAAESVGIDTARTKALAFALSAMVTSLAGSLYVQYIQYVDPYTSSTLSISLMICLVTVMGGCGTVFGPIVGATVLTYISQNTRVWFGGTGTGIDLIIYGALVILLVLFLPNGVLSIPGRLKKRFAKKEVPAA